MVELRPGARSAERRNLGLALHDGRDPHRLRAVRKHRPDRLRVARRIFERTRRVAGPHRALHERVEPRRRALVLAHERDARRTLADARRRGVAEEDREAEQPVRLERQHPDHTESLRETPADERTRVELGRHTHAPSRVVEPFDDAGECLADELVRRTARGRPQGLTEAHPQPPNGIGVRIEIGLCEAVGARIR